MRGLSFFSKPQPLRGRLNILVPLIQPKDKLERRMPFPLRAIQVDGGSEFEAIFEEECQRRNIRLFVLPPRSPKLNGYVEWAHRTHAEEFYEVTESSFDIGELRAQLLEWERTYNAR